MQQRDLKIKSPTPSEALNPTSLFLQHPLIKNVTETPKYLYCYLCPTADNPNLKIALNNGEAIIIVGF